MVRLTDIGFKKVGDWIVSGDKIDFVLTDCASARNILYCFVSEGTPLYVGKSVQPLQKRLYGYKNPVSSQTTNQRGNANIYRMLKSKQSIEIYALPDNGLLHFGAFHINLAAGLEDSIVKTLNPEWNLTGTARKKLKTV